MLRFAASWEIGQLRARPGSVVAVVERQFARFRHVTPFLVASADHKLEIRGGFVGQGNYLVQHAALDLVEGEIGLVEPALLSKALLKCTNKRSPDQPVLWRTPCQSQPAAAAPR